MKKFLLKIQYLGAWSNGYVAKIHLESIIGDGERYQIDKDVVIGVIGTVYDFTVTNVNEGNTVRWATSLFSKGNLGREYKADTLPIAQAKIYPDISTITDIKANERVNDTKPGGWNRGILLGGKFLFTINTKGLKSDSIMIIPKLTYYDSNGVKRNDVSFKYGELGNDFTDRDGNVLNVGTHFMTKLADKLREAEEIRTEQFKAVIMMGINERFNVTDSNILEFRSLINQYKSPQFVTVFDFGSFGKLVIPKELRLPYANYAGTDVYKSEVNKIGGYIDTSTNPVSVDDSKGVLRYSKDGYANASNNPKYITDISDLGMDEYKLINSLGHWYAEYSLPNSIVVVDNSGNQLNDGSIVVAFKISTLDTDGQTYLNYNETQWKKENLAIGNSVSGHLVKIELPNANRSVEYDISSGYYPVAIYSTDKIDLVISGNTH